MYSPQTMRKFVCDRLTVAAQEILGAFEKKIQEYEAEIARQRKMMDNMFTPEIKFSPGDLSQTSLTKDEQAALNRQSGRHETCSSLTRIKDENEEMIISQGTGVSKSIPASDRSVHTDMSQSLNPDQPNKEPQSNICDNDMLRESLATSTLHCDNQEISHILCDEGESLDHIVCSLENYKDSTASQNRTCNVENTSTSSIEQTQVQISKTSTEPAPTKRVTRTSKTQSNVRVLRGKTTSEPAQSKSKTRTTTRHTDLKGDGETSSNIKGRKSTSTGASVATPKEKENNKEPKTVRNEDVTTNVEDETLPSVELLQNTDADIDQLWDIDCFDYMLTESTELINTTEGCDNMTTQQDKADQGENTQHDDEDVTSDSSCCESEMELDSSEKPGPSQYRTASAKSTNPTPSDGKIESTSSKLRPKKKHNDQSTASTKRTSEKSDKVQTKSVESKETANVKRHNDLIQNKRNKEENTTTTTEKNTKENSTRGTELRPNMQNDDKKSTSATNSTNTTSASTVKPAPHSGRRFLNGPPKDFVNPYKCDICSKEMTNFKNYKFHMKSHTVEKSFKCETCGKMFRESWNLNKHLVIHSAQKPFTCDICGNGFNRRYNLDLHLRVHTGEKPYKCETCGKNFSSCVNMKKHIRIHTGEKPYTCGDCGKEFADSSSFKNHRRVHTGEKPFKCTYCKRKFATRTTMKRHTRTHTGEKPYKCNICDKVFGHRTDLKGHIRMHTGETPYKCSSCEKQFATWSQLNKHKRVHADDTQSSTSTS